MARVSAIIEEQPLENDSGRLVDGVVAVCGRCGHTTESFGTSDRSVRRDLALMREQCPMKQSNLYVQARED